MFGGHAVQGKNAGIVSVVKNKLECVREETM